jgi:hypothetical protein
MAPNPRLYPVSDVGETPTRVAYCEVLHPTAQDRIDLLDKVSRIDPVNVLIDEDIG